MVKQAVILCGGRGKRLRPITDTLPKPMVEVAGRPFVYYLVKILKDVGVEDIVLSVGYLKEEFSLDGVRYSEAKPVVNDSILNVLVLGKFFLVVNGDCLPILKWRQFLDTSQPRVAIKTKFGELKDVGICLVSRDLVENQEINCGDIRSLTSNPKFDLFVATGNLHIGTKEGLDFADRYLRELWRD